MALTKSDIPDLLLPGLRAEFAQAYRSELDTSVAERIATVVSTTMPAQRYAWLGAVPPMREFLDERRPQGLAANAVTIEDKTFESTIAVERKAVEDDQLELIRLRVRDLAFRVAAHRQQIVVEALASGFTALGYDGASLFSATHPIPGGTFSNRTTSALSANALAAAVTAMMTVPDDAGTPMGIVPDTLVVGPAQQWNALELVDSPVVVYKGNATDNAPSTPYRNALKRAAERRRLALSARREREQLVSAGHQAPDPGDHPATAERRAGGVRRARRGKRQRGGVHARPLLLRRARSLQRGPRPLADRVRRNAVTAGYSRAWKAL